MEIRDRDILWQTFRGSNPHDPTERTVTALHIPTGIYAEACEHSQYHSRVKVREELENKVKEYYDEEKKQP